MQTTQVTSGMMLSTKDGEPLIGVSVLNRYVFYYSFDTINTFEVLESMDDTIVSYWNPTDTDVWTDATFWCFKKR